MEDEVDFFSKVTQNQQIFSTVEKIPTKVFRTPTDASKIIATCIANAIREKQSMDENCILGLSTGSYAFNVYNELIRMHKDEGLSFRNCHAFMSNEYYPIEKSSIYSTYSIINKKFFSKVDFAEENCHFFDSKVESKNIRSYCDKFEKKIKNLGGIDVQILA